MSRSQSSKEGKKSLCTRTLIYYEKAWLKHVENSGWLDAGDKSGEGSEMTPEWHRVLTSLRVWAWQQAISFLPWTQWGAFEDFMLGNETESGSCSDMSSLFDALKKNLIVEYNTDI